MGVFGLGLAYHQVHSKHTLTSPFVLHIKRGTTLAAISDQLARAKVVRSATFFRYYFRTSNDFRKVKAGKYTFTGEVSMHLIAERLGKGTAEDELVLSVTIPEGFTLSQVAARLAAKGVGEKSTNFSLLTNMEFARSLGVNASTLEGYLYPETYLFHNQLPPPKGAVKAMVEEFFKQLPEKYETKVNEMGLTLNEAITFASLIEKETMLDEERPKISEVIWTRLKKGYPLGIDAAIIYGIEDYDGDIKWKHLRDKTNPYNSRIHKGLPPTPIGATSLASLKAVLTPSNFGYLYYVLIPNSGGKHKFTRTLKEHNKHVKILINSR